MRDYDSDNDDEIDVVPESLARRAPPVVDSRRACPLPNPPNDERHDDDDDEMDSLPPLPNTQIL
jgi:hypothetical protein